MHSRTYNTKRNIIWSYVNYIITVIFQFLSRYLIVRVLGAEYLGLSSLFTSILTVLNMTELGFSTAIIYSMYKPLAEGDDEKVCALLNYYKRIYHYVGSIIMVVGIVLLPFLPRLINGGWPADINIYCLYILYLINTSISYFLFAYKTALLNALQRLDLTKIAYCIVSVIQYTLQVIALVVFGDYYLFIIAIILGTVFKNFFTSYISKKKYPHFFCYGKISGSTKKNINDKVKGLLIGNVCGVTYTTLDSIIISVYIGLSSVAKYDNYMVICSGVSSVIVLIREAMQASVGNSVAIESIDKNYDDIKKFQFIFSVIAIWASTCMICLIQPIMEHWMGKDMLLDFVDVVLITMLFFVGTVQHAFFLYLRAAGLWLEVKWAYIVSSVCDLILNITLCQLWGITGIIFSTLFSCFVFGSIWQCVIVFKKYFKACAFKYLIDQFAYFGGGMISCIIAFFLCNFIQSNDIICLFLKVLVCSIVSLGVVFVIYGKKAIYRQCFQLMKNVVRK